MSRGEGLRAGVKRVLALTAAGQPADGLTVLIYHRVGGGTPDERDLSTAAFAAQLDTLAGKRVVPLDLALDELAVGDNRAKVVVTFDDGFADLHEMALPLLAERRIPFTLYLATAFVGGDMHWDGSTASAPGPALSWAQLRELLASSLCTIGNHTDRHVPPALLSVAEIERCSDAIEQHLGVRPRHFAYPWGLAVAGFETALRARFRSAATGRIGRNHPGTDPLRLRRVPVRGTDPLPFFAAKLTGRLGPERAYAGIVATAKRVGVSA